METFAGAFCSSPLWLTCVILKKAIRFGYSLCKCFALPHGVGEESVAADAQEFIWNCDAMEIGLLAVHEKRVRLPDAFQEQPVH